jgi:hypothetical protein
MSQPVHGGGSVEVIAHRAAVVYEETSGAIKHIHQNLTFEGGQVPSESEMEQAALDILSRRVDVRGLKVLHVDGAELRPRVKYRVDSQQRTLIETK